MSDLIKGSMGGSGGGGASTPIEAENTLRSKSYAVLLDLISEGPIKGFKAGGNSVLFNDTPVLNEDKTTNYPGTGIALMAGTPGQSVLTGFPNNDLNDPAYTMSIGVVVKTDAAVTRTVAASDTGASAVKIVINISALFQTDSNGNVNPYSVSYRIETRIGSMPWQSVISDTVNGKTTSPYEREYRVNRPSGTGASWDVRVSRLSPDDATTNSKTNSVFSWSKYTIIYDNRLSYPNSAYVALFFDASRFGTSIPTRKYHVLGKLVQLPSNYDPYTKLYTGLWDGTFKFDWTDNPAWVFYDLVTSRRYGAGAVINPATVDKWSLYSVGQYCDEQVPDGQGGTEARFTFNGVLDRPDDGIRVLQQIASMFDSIVFGNSSLITLVQDRPEQPSKIFSVANVVDGNFRYEGTSLATRPTVIRALFIDKHDNYAPAIEVVEDPDRIAQWGRVPQDIQLIGCTSRGQAYRKAANTIDVSWSSAEIATFRVGLEDADTLPGDMIAIADANYQDVRYGGRCAPGCTPSVILLDAPITLDTNNPDGSLASFQILLTQAQDVPLGRAPNTADRVGTNGVAIANLNGPTTGVPITTLQLAAPLSFIPDPGTPWLVSSTALAPRTFKVLSVMEVNAASFEIKAVFFDQTRRDRVELGVKNPPPPFFKFSNIGDFVSPPSGVSARDYFVGVGTTTIVRATVSFTPPNDNRLTGTDVRAVSADTGGSTTYGHTETASFDFDNLPLGTYTFGARSTIIGGRVSEWADSAPILVDGSRDAPPAPLNLTATGATRQVFLKWTAVPVRDLLHYEVWSNSTGTLGTASMLVNVDSTNYTHNDPDLLLPNTTRYYWVRAILTTLTPTGLFAGPVQGTTTYLLTDDLAEEIRNTAKYAQELLGGAPLVVDNLNTPGTHEPQLVFLRTDQKLYSWDNTHQIWVPYIAVVPQSSGKLTGDQVGAITNATISGSLTPDQTQQLIAGISAGGITSDKIASLVGSKVTGSLSNAQIVAGNIYETDGQGVVTQGINTTRLVGTIQGSAITGNLPNATLQASSIRDVDPLTLTQVSGIQAARIAGQLVASQIAAGAITTGALAVGSPDNVIANSCFSYSGDGWGQTSVTITPVIGTSMEVNYSPTADGAGLATTGNLTSNNFGDLEFNAGRLNGFSYNTPIPTAAGECWEAQICYLPVLGTVTLFLLYVDSSGQLISPTFNSGPQTYAPPTNGKALSSWNTIGVRGAAPTNAVAVGLLVRLTNNTGSTAVASAYLTRALLGRTVPNATALLGWVPGGVTSISGGLIQTNAIKARTIQANQIGAREIAVGNSANVITNSCLAVTPEGWGAYASGGSLAQIGSCSAGHTAYLTKDGCGYIEMTLNAGSYADVSYKPITCIPGETLELQAMVLPLFGQCAAYLSFQTAAGANVAYSAPTNTVLTQATPSASQQGGLSAFSLVSGVVTVPATADTATLVLRFSSDTAGTGVNYFTRASLGRTFAGATQISPWSPGGVTTIGGGVLASESVVTRVLAAGAVSAEKLSVGSPTNVIWNGCCGQSGAGWMGGVQAWPAGGAFALAGFGTGYCNLNLSSGQTNDISWAPNNGTDGSTFLYDGVHSTPWGAAAPCTPGQLLEAQVRVNTHRCSVELFLLTLGINPSTGNMDLIGVKSTGARSFVATNPARTVADYQPLVVRDIVPLGATYCTLMIRMGNTLASQAIFGSQSGVSGFLFFTQAGLGTYLPNVPAPMPWAQGGNTIIDGGMVKAASVNALQLSAGSVTAGAIAAGSVTTGALAASSVTAEKAAFGSPSNVIWNPCVDQTTDGWSPNTFGPLMPLFGNAAINEGPASQFYLGLHYLKGFGSALSQYTGSGLIGSNQGFYWDWSPTPGMLGVPAQIGKQYGAQALIAAGNDCTAFLQIIFIDSNGIQVGASTQSNTFKNNAPQTGAVYPDQYGLATAIAIAPAATASVILRLAGTGSAAGATQPFFVFSQAAIGQMPVGATNLGAWVPGGVTTISGNMVKTGTLDANRVNAGTIVAGSAFVQALTATTVTANSIKSVLVTTNRLTASQIDADTLTVGSVKAGAIGADQIAAGQLHAYHLAADFVLANAAQFGTAVIGTAQIGNLVVTGDKLVGGAVSQVSLGLLPNFIGGSRSLFLSLGVPDTHGTGIVIWMRGFLESVQSSGAGVGPPLVSGGSGGDGGNGDGSS